MARAELGILTPGQGTGFSPRLAHADGMRGVCDEIQKSLPGGALDVWDLLRTPTKDRPVSPEAAHLLLAVVAGYAAFRFGEYKNKSIVALTGHSAGLIAAGVRTDKLAEVLYTRAQLLSHAQRENPGAMYALYVSGEDGFHQVVDWIRTHNEEQRRVRKSLDLWLACINFVNPDLAQLVVTARQECQVAELVKSNIGDVLRRDPIRLPIAVGAHSPLVRKAEKQFATYLASGVDYLRSFTPDEPVFVSDHVQPGEKNPVVSRDGHEIVRELATFSLPVEFARTIQFMVNRMDNVRVTEFWEIGSAILGDFIRKMPLPTPVTVKSILTPNDFDEATRGLDNLLEV